MSNFTNILTKYHILQSNSETFFSKVCIIRLSSVIPDVLFSTFSKNIFVKIENEPEFFTEPVCRCTN
jgi:hypothetical protein